MTKRKARRGNGSHAIGDITGGKPAERDLRGLEEEWRSLAENIPDIILTVDAGGTILFVNRTLSDQPVESVVGDSVYDYTPPDQHDELRKRLQRVFDRGQAHSFEMGGPGPFGRTSWYFSRIGPIVRDGRVVAAVLITTDISERKRAEEALRDSEARFRSTLDNMMEGALIIGFDWRYLYANDAVARHTSRAREELLGNTMMEMHPGIENTEEFARLRRCMEERVPDRMEWRYAYPDGSTAWFDVSVQPVPEGIFMLFLNITDRKRAEEALRDSEERYRDLVEDINDIVFSVNADGLITYISPVATEVGGYNPAEMVGRPFTDFLHPDDVSSAMEGFQRSISGDHEPVEMRFLSKSGELRWLRNFGRPILDGDRVVGLRGVLTDVTQRKRAEEALRDSEESYRRVVEDTPVLICCFLPGSEITFVNRAYCEYFAKTSEELVGSNFLSLIPEGDRETVMVNISALTVDSPTQSHEHQVIAPGGDIRWQRWTNRALFDAQGKVVAYQSIGEDITERKLVEEALEERTHDLGERVKELNCLYGISKLTDELGISLEKIVQGTVDLIPASFQYPEVTCARIILEDQEFRTENFSEAPWRQTADITVHGAVIGSVEVCYLEEWPESDDGPFLKEERTLIKTVAGRMGHITERKRAEEALRQSEKRYRELVEDINDIIYEVDASGRITYISPVEEEVGGYKPSDMVGRPWTDFLHPDDHATAIEDFRKNVSGDVEPREYRMMSKAGETYWVRSFGRPILDGDRIVGMRGVMTIITERKRAEAALRESEERWRSLAENAPDIIMTVDADSTILFANRVVPGLAIDSVIGTSLYDYVPPEHRDMLRRALERLFDTGEPQSYEIAGTGPGGGTAWYFSRMGPVVRDGRVVAAILITTDITEQRRAEDALEESEERYRTLVEAAPDVIYSLSTDGTIVSLNSAFESSSGWSRDEWLGKSFAGLIHPDDLPAATEDFRLVMQGEVPPPGQYRVLVKSGQYFTVETMPRPLFADGEVVGTFGIARDITERRRAEEELRESEARLRAFANAVPDIAFILDENGLYVEVLALPESKDLLFTDADAVRGRQLHDVLPEKTADQFLSVVRKTIETQEPQVLEYVLDVQAGGRWFEGRTAPLSLAGENQMVVWISRDITESKQAEAALQKAREELESTVERQMQRGTAYGLTFRELTVLHLMADGRSDREIGTVLGISTLTAQKHVENIRAKMGASSRTEASVRAVREALLD